MGQVVTKEVLQVRLARMDEIPDVAEAAEFLHHLENGDPLSPAATADRAAAFLRQIIEEKSGEVLVAALGCEVMGCIVVQWNIIPQMHTAYVGGLFTRPEAPMTTALRLMQAAAHICRKRDRWVVYIATGTEKNNTRRTYARLGFKPVTTTASTLVHVGCLWDIEKGLRRRLRGKGTHHGINR